MGAVVLKEIQKMLDLIAKEEKADDEQLEWCNKERQTNNANLQKKEGEITDLEVSIDTLTKSIMDPETGLKTEIAETEKSLETNVNNQKEQTTTRKEDNLAYQQNIANLVEAQRILTKAVTVLKAYYSKILKAEASFLGVSHSKQPTPPPTWEDDYVGQKKD